MITGFLESREASRVVATTINCSNERPMQLYPENKKISEGYRIDIDVDDG